MSGSTKGDKLLSIRFSHEADELLRAAGGVRRGELARRIFEALDETDWHSVELEERPRTPGKKKEYVITTMKVPPDTHEQLTQTARERDTSVSILIDGCVRAHFKKAAKKRPEKGR